MAHTARLGPTANQPQVRRSPHLGLIGGVAVGGARPPRVQLLEGGAAAGLQGTHQGRACRYTYRCNIILQGCSWGTIGTSAPFRCPHKALPPTTTVVLGFGFSWEHPTTYHNKHVKTAITPAPA